MLKLLQADNIMIFDRLQPCLDYPPLEEADYVLFDTSKKQDIDENHHFRLQIKTSIKYE